VKLAGYGAAALLLLGLVFALRIVVLNFLGERADYLRSAPAPISRHPERTGIPGLHEVSFTDTTGTPIAGWYAPSRNRAALVLVHGTAAERSGVLDETRLLATAGFGTLAIDMPGQGASGGQTQWGAAERRAISAAVDWLALQPEIDARCIGGFGLSMGAYVMTQAAVLDQRLRAVVLAGAPPEVVEQNWVSSNRWGLLSQLPVYWALRLSPQSFDMPPKEVIGRIAPRAVYLVGGDQDTAVPEYMAQQLFAAAGAPKQLWIVPGARHADYLRAAPVEYPARLVEFFRHRLLDNPGCGASR
jgi:dipeptidyl aminopeptidase/acylaminoacyl peptidase